MQRRARGISFLRTSQKPTPSRRSGRCRPQRQQCGAIVRAHARLHASWWDSPRLGVSVGTWLDSEAMDRQMQLVASDFQRFADRAGDLLSRVGGSAL